MVDASLGEILVTVEKLKWTIQHGETALKPERRPTSFLMMYKVNEVRWEPLGVVAACVSWKYVFVLTLKRDPVNQRADSGQLSGAETETRSNDIMGSLTHRIVS